MTPLVTNLFPVQFLLLSADAAPAAVADGTDLVPRFLAVLGIMLVVGKLSGELFDRIGQPGVMGELLAGALLGASLLGIIPTDAADPLSEPIALFAEIGVLLLLFEIGIETDLKQMLSIGNSSLAVAVVGVMLPLGFGVLYWISPLLPPEFLAGDRLAVGVFVGATLTATSVGITARVLTDLKVMSSLEARIVIGAAVIDDILGLVLLGIVSTLVAGGVVSVLGVGAAFGVAIGFIVVAVVLGFWIAPRLFDYINAMNVRGTLLVGAFAFMLLLAASAANAGSALIIGAFAAGLVMSRTNQFDLVRDRIRPVADVFTPVFFLSIGAQLDVRVFNPFVPGNGQVILVGLSLFVIAVLGKLASAWAVWWRSFNRPAVGLGMMPRGEVGLVFAQIGLSSGLLSPPLFSAILLMIIGTTFVAPVMLKWSFGRWGTTPNSS